MALGPGRARILVVDDVPGQRLAVEAALADLGEDIVAVASGLDALRFLLEHDVAVILLDVNMPEMDGFETASLIRQRPRSRHTPIIFLTADADEMLAARGYSLGAVDFIFNPLLPDVLRAKVQVFVDLAKMQEQVRREAEQRIALSREQAARAAAEDDSRRLRFLAEASRLLTRSLDTAPLVGELLALFVPRIAELAAVVLVDEGGRDEATMWRHAAMPGQLSREPIGMAGVPQMDAMVRAVLAHGRTETLTADGGGIRGVVMPLAAGRRSFGAMVTATVGPAPCYTERDIELFHDVAGRLAMALENGRLYKTIHDRDRQKDEFLAMLSHELRNPLGAIAGAVRLLETLEWSDERAARAREVVARQSTHLTRIVDDLLDVARLTAGRITLITRPVDLADAVARAIDTLRVAGSLEHHQVKITVVPVMVQGDQARLQQVVTNLVVNALKYTDRGGGIEVQVADEQGEAVVRVRDTGIGISDDMRSRLFELFAQGDQALDRAQGGLGIGLALVRRIVELHGGRVEAWSDGPGRGSVFTIRLPRLAAVPAAASTRPPPARDAASLRILVVEDNSDSRDMLRILLELAGHEVLEARDGPEGLRLAIDTKPEIALVDLGLPGFDGLELASRIRATPDGKAIALVAVTGYGQASDRRRALEAGFDLHLTKPIDVERLHEILALAVRRDAGATIIEHDA